MCAGIFAKYLTREFNKWAAQRRHRRSQSVCCGSTVAHLHPHPLAPDSLEVEPSPREMYKMSNALLSISLFHRSVYQDQDVDVPWVDGSASKQDVLQFFSKIKHVIKLYIHWCTATIPLSTVLSIIAQITSVIVILNVFSDSIKQNQTMIKTNQLIVV